MDPDRLGDWVSIHRRLLHADDGPPRVGYEMDQQIHMRGGNLGVHWKLIDCRSNGGGVWEGGGAAGSRARPKYFLPPDVPGPRFSSPNEFRPPLGPVGAIVSR